ncbi:hypothetical protein ACFWVF_23930 [Streptomyces sp. NPDC058659]
MSRSTARTREVVIPWPSITDRLRSIRPSVLLTSGERLSVQL